MKKKVFYIGDKVKMNGPSNVDIGINNLLSDYIIFSQATKFNSIFSEIKLLFLCKTCHVSNINFKGFLFYLLSILLFKKRVLLLHGLKIEEGKYTRVKLRRYIMEYLLIRLSSELVVVSESLLRQFKSNYPNMGESKKIHVIPNPVSYNKNQNIFGSENLICCIGGGRPEKGVLNVCKAIEKLNDNLNLKLRLIVFGEDGEDTHCIKNYKFVDYRGFCKSEEVFSALGDSLIFIQYSYQESFSMALFEALDCGCFIICSDKVGAIDYLGETEHIYISKVNDIDDLSSVIVNVLDNDKRFFVQDFRGLDKKLIIKTYKEIWFR